MKAWNGGSIERAMELARERRDKLIAQGADLCTECNGEGGAVAAGVCIQCHGAGVIIPPGGLTLEDEIVAKRCSGDLEEAAADKLDDDCDCEHAEEDILTGRAKCFRCGRVWYR